MRGIINHLYISCSYKCNASDRIGQIKSTKENLNDAIAYESYEMTTMYTGFIKTSDEGKVNLASVSFNYAYKTEMKHKIMYETALSSLNNDKEGTFNF